MLKNSCNFKMQSILSIICILSISYSRTKGQASFIDPNVILVERWEGWGTSLAWWADVLGGMDDSIISNVTEALFNREKLNLNIVRYVIGGTTPQEVTPFPCGEYRDGAASESFRDGPTVSYNWTRDGRQRRVLQEAKALGVNTFEAFSNSPPQWMTISGCAKGNPGGLLLHSNLGADRADDFSNYAADVIKYFHENLGITFATYAPFNEPYGLDGIGSWFGADASQEGCNMNRTVMVEVVKSLHNAFTARNMSYVTITTADETQVNTGLQTHNFFIDAGISNLISKVNVHGYWDLVTNRRDLLSILTHQEGHKLWMDEMGWGGTPLSDMTQGMEIANRIIKDVRHMLPSAWVYWQAMEDIGAWGMLSVPFDNPNVDDIVINSGYHAMMQFSKYIKQGYQIIYVTDEDSIAAFDASSENLVLVCVNNGESVKHKEYDLRTFATVREVKAFLTSNSSQNEPVNFAKLHENKTLSFDLNPESILTVVVSNSSYLRKVNMILNGDFESKVQEEISAWKVEPGLSGEIGIDSDFPWRGNNNGVLGSSTGNVTRLFQTVTIANTGNVSYQLFLSAWCSASATNAKLGAEVNANGNPHETSVAPNVGYQSYGLSFEVRAGDEVKFYIESANGKTTVDNINAYLIYLSS